MLPTPGNGTDSAAPGTPTALVPGPNVNTPFVPSHVGADIVTSPVESVLDPDALLHMTPMRKTPGGKVAAKGVSLRNQLANKLLLVCINCDAAVLDTWLKVDDIDDVTAALVPCGQPNVTV